jgi:hypothetical protein
MSFTPEAAGSSPVDPANYLQSQLRTLFRLLIDLRPWAGGQNREARPRAKITGIRWLSDASPARERPFGLGGRSFLATWLASMRAVCRRTFSLNARRNYSVSTTSDRGTDRCNKRHIVERLVDVTLKTRRLGPSSVGAARET